MRNQYRGGVALPLALVGLLFLAGCKEEVAQKPEEIIRPVKTVTVSATGAVASKSYSGSIKARSDASVGFRVGGKIVARMVNVGDRVQAGQVIARLDPTDLQLAVNSANAQVEAARARKDLADDQYSRVQALKGKGFATQAQLDQASNEVDQSASALRVALANREQIGNQAAYADLKADADGIVTEVRADVGQVVASGTPVVVLARDAEKEVAVNVPEQDVGRIRIAQDVRVTPWVSDVAPFAGKVREIAGSADPASRTFAVRVSLPETAPVRLGMTATVEVSLPVAQNGITVPLTALARVGSDTVAWVVDPATSKVSSRKIELGAPVSDGVEVRGGLKSGDIVVVAGTQFMREGKQVRLMAATDRLASAKP